MHIVPHDHDGHEEESENERKKPALSELIEDGGEVEELDGAEDEEEGGDEPNAGLPDDDHDEGDHGGGHDHDGDDGDAVGMADVLGGAEGDGDDDAGQHEEVVDLRDVNLALVLVGCMDHLHAREAAERERLGNYGEGSGDHGLARYDGSRHGYYEGGPVQRIWD